MAVDIGPKIGIDGEKQFRDSIQNINQQIKTLASEMKATTSAFKDNADAEKKSEAQAKNLTEQIDAQKKKLDLLKEGLEKSTEKFGANDTRTLKWRQSIAEATATLNGMEAELKNVTDDVGDAGDEMDEAGGKASRFGDVLKASLASETIVAGIKALKNGIKSVASALKDATLETAANADQIDKQSQKIGISREEYQKLAYAFDKYGTSVDVLKNGMKTLATQAQKNSKAFETLGISQEKLRTSSPEQLFDIVIESLQGMEEGTERTTVATQLLGKAAVELAPVLNDTNASYKALKDEAPLMADATITAGADMTDAMSKFKTTVGEIKTAVVTNVMPAVTKALDSVRKTLSKGDSRKAIEKVGKSLGKIVGSALELGAKVLPVVAKILTNVVDNFGAWAIAIGAVVVAFKGFAIIKSLTTAVNAAKTAFAGLNAVMSANPYGAVLAAIGLLIGAITSFVLVSDDASGSAGKLSEKMQEIKDASEAADESYRNALDAFRDEDSVLNANIKRTKDLWDELQVLAGATGNVNEKDRERAEYILGELNNALGTEYEMTGNQISQYRDMRDSIYEVIAAKQANSKLELAKGLYDDALQNKQSKVDEMLAYAKGVEIAQENLDNAIANHNENIRIAAEKGDFGYAERTATAWKMSLDQYQSELFNAEQSFGQAQKVVGAYENTIATYEDASYAIATGDYEKGIRLINSLTGARFDAYEETTKLSENETNQLKNSIAEQEIIVKAYRAGEAKKMEGFTKKTLDAEQQKLDRMKRLYSNQGKVWIAKGIEFAEGFANGIGQNSGSARRKAEEIVSGVIEAVDAAGGNARYAGETVSNSFSDGIFAYSNRAVENSAKMASDVIKRLDCIDQANRMGKYIAQGLADGLTSEQKYVMNKTDKLINELLFGIADTAGIASPSKVTKGYGRYIMQGLTAGMGEELSKTIGKTRNMVSKVLDTMDVSRYGNLAYAGVASSGNSYTTDMGGITINMTVSAPGVSDVNDLATMVSDRIRDAILDIQQSRR